LKKQVNEKYKNYGGININELIDLEEHFHIAVNIVHLNEDDTMNIIRLSEYEGKNGNKSIWLNMYLTHFSFIRNIGALRHKCVCEKCNKMFTDRYGLSRHMQSKTQCNVKFIDEFENVSKVFKPKLNIMKRLYNKYPEYFSGIDIYFNHFLAYDVEAINHIIYIINGENTKYYRQHIPISVSVGSNIDKKIKFLCARNKDEIDGMMKEFIEYVNGISDYYYNAML